MLDPGLYLVATPIGNLEDITLRALRVLRQAHLVACEDTRVSRTLLSAYDIHVKTVPYHDHNADEMRPKLLQRLRDGEAIALISDAGTPLVSDPGFKLARDCIEAGMRVVAIPGASAVMAGLSVSGLPSDRFLFGGFLPSRQSARLAALRELEPVAATLILYESPGRVQALLEDALSVLGDRPAAVARELTKKFEETRRGGLSDLATHYAQAGAPRGEVVILIGGYQAGMAAAIVDIDALLKAALSGGISVKQAVAAVSADTKLPRREIYARALALKSGA